MEASALSVNALAGEAVASGPVGTLRAGFSVGIVDAFFVWAPDDSVSDNDRLDAVLFYQRDNLLANIGVLARVHVLREPAFEWLSNLAIVTKDGDNDLGGELGSRTIEAYGR